MAIAWYAPPLVALVSALTRGLLNTHTYTQLWDAMLLHDDPSLIPLTALALLETHLPELEGLEGFDLCARLSELRLPPSDKVGVRCPRITSTSRSRLKLGHRSVALSCTGWKLTRPW
jgi:hypothetical protein